MPKINKSLPPIIDDSSTIVQFDLSTVHSVKLKLETPSAVALDTHITHSIYVQGGPQGEVEEDQASTSTSTQQPSTSTSSPGHQPQPAYVESGTVSSSVQQQPLMSSSSGTGTTQHTTTAESRVTPAHTEGPSARDTVETCVPPPKTIDTALWSAHILDADHVEIVQRGPFKVSPDFKFLKGPDGRAFHTSLQFKTLPNGEKVHRSWLLYSPQNNAVFCFVCKLFSTKDIKLTADGYSDWSNINTSLRGHKWSQDHTQCMLK